MSYLVSNNNIVLQKSRFVGSHSNHTLNTLTKLGWLGGWLCIIPAAIIIGTSDEYSAIDGTLFMVAAFVASYIASIDTILGRAYGFVVGYLLSASTLPINLALVIYLYIHLH